MTLLQRNAITNKAVNLDENVAIVINKTTDMCHLYYKGTSIYTATYDKMYGYLDALHAVKLNPSLFAEIWN